MTCKFNKKSDLPKFSEKFDRLEDSPTFDPQGKKVFYGKCDCGCVTEDRGILEGVQVGENEKENVPFKLQLHWCYHCNIMNSIEIGKDKN